MLEELGENVGQSFPKLKRLVMQGCESLKRLPESIGHLTDLEHLDLTNCIKLVTLPDSIVRLVSLRLLQLDVCDELQQLPEELGKLTNLETLSVCYCDTLSKLPASVGGLKMLKTLNMESTGVRDLPMGFGLLTSLTSLILPGLCSVGEIFQGLQSLTLLDVLNGFGDMGGLGALTALKELKLCQHGTITTLPKSLGNLKLLVHLDISECVELLTVEALPEGLEHLDFRHCINLVEIPSLASMRSLMYLDLTNCKKLRCVRGLEFLTTLKVIDTVDCTSIEGCRIGGVENSALEECDVRGSRVSVPYNNRWSEVRGSSSLLSIDYITQLKKMKIYNHHSDLVWLWNLLSIRSTSLSWLNIGSDALSQTNIHGHAFHGKPMI
jgi:Leucine-rich repeat (LRR) protein